jgi:ribosomal protein S18 acetylase RimI-like enzyme
LVVSLRGDPIGCRALKFHANKPADLKRMWVAESARGLGIGRRLLSALEDVAAGHGARIVRLETNRSLSEAIGLYRSSGYLEIDPFNEEPYAHHWFEKPIGPRGRDDSPAGPRSARTAAAAGRGTNSWPR